MSSIFTAHLDRRCFDTLQPVCYYPVVKHKVAPSSGHHQPRVGRPPDSHGFLLYRFCMLTGRAAPHPSGSHTWRKAPHHRKEVRYDVRENHW